MEKSKQLKLNKEDGLKMLKGLGIAVGGAVLAYAAGILVQIDFGPYTATAVIAGGLVINFLRKLLAGTK